MFTVILVDDEPWALLGMRNCYNWENNGYQIVFETTNALQALEAIKSQKPDVVLTDIRMNKMSGIELIESVRQAGLDTEFVIASGYDDFCYAKEAIKHRAFHYVLKPLNEDEIIDVFTRLAGHLNRKKAAQDKIENLSLLDDFPYNSELIAKYLQDNGMSRKYPFYQVIVTHDQQRNQIELEFPEETFRVELYLSANKKAYFINTQTDIREYSGIYRPSRKDFEVPSVGISTICKAMDKIGTKYREADIAVYDSFVTGKPAITCFEKKNTADLNKYIGIILSKLDSKDSCQLAEAFDNLKAVFVQNRFGIGEAAFFYNQFIANISYRHPDIILAADLDFLTYDKIYKKFRDLTDLLDYLMDTVLLIGQQNLKLDGSTNETFKKLVKYVETNYYNSLFLSDIAKMFNMNATYICDLFKKSLGMTFIEYLSYTRMNRATELLKETDYSIMQIADEVGYGDYCYFSKLFKGQFGMTPTKYRKQYRC